MAAAGEAMPQTREELVELIRQTTTEFWSEMSVSPGGATGPPWIAQGTASSQDAAQTSEAALAEAVKLQEKLHQAAQELKAQGDLIKQVFDQAEKNARQQQADLIERQKSSSSQSASSA